ncbi:MAG: sulfite exporter TauE/SafE family protein [Candidatus Marinimicrobia bacterium]|nr:sulfite exporter TauE/SafE family protein [Candidatus Neomarinimicrobiota bacterium]
MNTEIIILIILAAFICEIIDSSLGMLYGTILSPSLIIAGFDPLIVVPSILLSQAMGSFIASTMHHRLSNAHFHINTSEEAPVPGKGLVRWLRKNTSQDLKVVLIITATGIITTVIAVATAIHIPKEILKTYIGVLVLAMGVILLLKTRFPFSWKKVFGVGLISAFNKGMSGGGFGPVVTSGQIISGRSAKKSIGTTALSEAPICIAGFLAYWLINGMSEWNLVIFLTIGAVVGAFIGPFITAKIKSEKGLILALGIIVTLLGLWTLAKTWIA